jgi:hypothetical protein
VPSGVKLMPHRHPEPRVYTVMSGVFYIGLGDRFDGDKVKGLLVMLLPPPLSGASPSGATPVVAGEPMSGRLQLQTWQAACAPPDSCVAQASAGEPDESRPVETGQSPVSAAEVAQMERAR